MTFADAVRSALTQYVGFRGRARRSEYWWFALFLFVVAFAAGLVDTILGTEDMLTGIVILALALPSLAVTVRRLHDIDRTGWWALVSLVPFLVTSCFWSSRSPTATAGRTASAPR